MKNGNYDIRLSAGSYAGNGVMEVVNDHGLGHDGVYKLEVRLQGAGSKLTSTTSINMSPEVVRNWHLPARYSLSMVGTEREEDFSLLGTGPLGLIIELNGQWTAKVAHAGPVLAP
jgi:hypothetical protein